jgi:hypothetical protein
MRANVTDFSGLRLNFLSDEDRHEMAVSKKISFLLRNFTHKSWFDRFITHTVRFCRISALK